MKRIGALVLLSGVAHNNAWKLMPADWHAHAWNASGGLFDALLLGVIGWLARSAVVWLAVCLCAGFALQTAACSAAYLYSPWTINAGDELCSAGLHFPAGLVGLWAAVCVALMIRGQQDGRTKP